MEVYVHRSNSGWQALAYEEGAGLAAAPKPSDAGAIMPASACPPRAA